MGCVTRRDASAASLRHYITKNKLESCFCEPYPAGMELHFCQKGEFLCRMGEPAEYFSLLVDGKAQVIPSSVDGRMVLLTGLKPIAMLGDIELLNGCHTLHDVSAETDLVMLSITPKLFRQLMAESLPFVQLVCELLAKKVYQSSMQQSSAMLYPLRCRLSRWFIEEIQAAGSHTISVRMLALAQELGASDRHLRRVLNDFIQLGVIDKKGRRIMILDLPRLQELSQNTI